MMADKLIERQRCEHGVYYPHPCDDCDVEALKPANLIAQIADLTAERDALREALGDSQETLCAVRATSVSDDWAEASTAKHLHDICGDTMQRNATALKGDPANG